MSQLLVLWNQGFGVWKGGIGAGAADVAGLFSLGEQNTCFRGPGGLVAMKNTPAWLVWGVGER